MLREQLGPPRLRFTDNQRIRLAARARKLPRRTLYDSVSVVTPDTLFAWHRHLIARITTSGEGPSPISSASTGSSRPGSVTSGRRGKSS